MSTHNQAIVYFVLYLLAAVCFLLATVNTVFPRPRTATPAAPAPRVPFNLVALGLLFITIVLCCVEGQVAFR